MGRKREHIIDDEYFNTIDSHQKAYIVGFLYADGTIDKNGFTINIHKRDIKILEFIKKELKTDYLIKPNSNNDYVVFKIVSEKITKDLISYGILKNKTYTSKTLPLLNQTKFINSMLCGFFDGDGSIYFSSYKNRRQEYGCCFSSNIWVLNEIKTYLMNNGISSSKIRHRRTNNFSCMLEIRGSNNIKKLFYLLYANNNFILERKYEKFLFFLQQQEGVLKRLSKENVDEIISLFLSGTKQIDISKKTNINYGAVRGVIKRMRNKKSLVLFP